MFMSSIRLNFIWGAWIGARDLEDARSELLFVFV